MTVVEALCPPLAVVAEIVTVADLPTPLAVPVTTPAALTLAVPEALLAHVTDLLLALAGVTVAVSCCVLPDIIAAPLDTVTPVAGTTGAAAPPDTV